MNLGIFYSILYYSTELKRQRETGQNLQKKKNLPNRFHDLQMGQKSF